MNAEIKRTSTSYLASSDSLLINQLPNYIKIPKEFNDYYLSKKIDLKTLITKAIDDSIQ